MNKLINQFDFASEGRETWTWVKNSQQEISVFTIVKEITIYISLVLTVDSWVRNLSI